MTALDKIGLVAGAGDLPVGLANHCAAAGRPVFVVRLASMASPSLTAFEGCELGVGEVGGAIAALKRAGCASVCFVGKIVRPDLRTLRADARTL
ncbi:MAG: DUF1009 domain-containing protein, partial [Caulobacteraceae bacterium]|nr:DUF1009 domain-containing protein [Caulobacteraceae bacterium]